VQLRIRRQHLARNLGAQPLGILGRNHPPRGVAVDFLQLVAVDLQIIGGRRRFAHPPAQQHEAQNSPHANRQCRNDDPETHVFSFCVAPM
jgi:hypothetical protein